MKWFGKDGLVATRIATRKEKSILKDLNGQKTEEFAGSLKAQKAINTGPRFRTNALGDNFLTRFTGKNQTKPAADSTLAAKLMKPKVDYIAKHTGKKPGPGNTVKEAAVKTKQEQVLRLEAEKRLADDLLATAKKETKLARKDVARGGSGVVIGGTAGILATESSEAKANREATELAETEILSDTSLADALIKDIVDPNNMTESVFHSDKDIIGKVSPDIYVPVADEILNEIKAPIGSVDDTLLRSAAITNLIDKETKKVDKETVKIPKDPYHSNTTKKKSSSTKTKRKTTTKRKKPTVVAQPSSPYSMNPLASNFSWAALGLDNAAVRAKDAKHIPGAKEYQAQLRKVAKSRM